MDDYDLIEASFWAQYGIRLRTAELDFAEFLNLCSCLMPETPLGAVVSVRAEDDVEVLKNFTPAQKRIRNEWRKAHTSEQDEKQIMDALFRAALA